MIVSSFDFNVNFWKVKPDLAMVNPFKKLYKSDNSRNKEVSSKKMWCVAFIWDRDSSFYNLPEDVNDPDSKIRLIFEEYYGKFKTYEDNVEMFEELRDAYIKLEDTPARRSLRELEAQLEERTLFMKGLKYDIGELDYEKGKYVGGTAEIKDKMLANSDKIYTQYEKIKKIVENEDAAGVRNKGGGASSLSDQGLI